MKVNVTERAQADLGEIAARIGAENPLRAATFARELWTKCQSLADHPERFPAVASIAGHRIRKLSHRGYLIFYYLSVDHVEVIRIVHGARDWSALLGEGE